MKSDGCSVLGLVKPKSVTLSLASKPIFVFAPGRDAKKRGEARPRFLRRAVLYFFA